ncbi:hypothetical protein O181_047741 [Austropuccinia psidii MF-1]|uniref:Uncharacterized protein n=1 Tax=Austropuccinia psidii MF-1 TaxID=1389203 RepID=A0A9Q3DWN1_9BASI|nr:hypothetical protein [Austropuccinia psidii MF-1]
MTGSRQREFSRWTNVVGPIPIRGRPIHSSSELTISRINNEGVVKIIRQIAYSPTNLDVEGSEKFDGEEAEKFHSHLIPSTPRNFKPVLSSVPSSAPPPSPNSPTSRLILASPMKTSPVPPPRKSPVLTSHRLQPVARSSGKREDW